MVTRMAELVVSNDFSDKSATSLLTFLPSAHLVCCTNTTKH